MNVDRTCLPVKLQIELSELAEILLPLLPGGYEFKRCRFVQADNRPGAGADYIELDVILKPAQADTIVK